MLPIIAVSSCFGVQSPPPTHVACSVGIELTSLMEHGRRPNVPCNGAIPAPMNFSEIRKIQDSMKRDCQDNTYFDAW